ncbi:MAG: alpha/beta fold hydrolase [Janthinobacterium lividum]
MFLTLAAVLPLLGTAGAAEPPGPRHAEMVHGANGVVIETFVEGKGPAIVMLPSTGRDGAADFDAVAARLAAYGFTVLRPQPRGAERSVGPMEGVSLHELAADVVLVIERLGQGRAVILGHAFGHFVARMAAVDSPARVRGVVLAAAAASSWAPEIAATPGIAGDLSRPDSERLAALRLGFFAPGHDPTPWLQGWWPAAQRVQVNSREKAGVKQSDWWSAGTAPLLELIPASDPFKPQAMWGELKQSYGERVTTVVIPDASHALFPEQPAAVADAVADWVRTLPP